MQKLIQSNRNIIEQIEYAVRSFRKQNYFDGNLQVKKIFGSFSRVLEVILSNKDIFNEHEEIVNEDDWIAVINETMEAQEKEDYVLLADLLECNWIPRLLKLQMNMIMLLTNGSGVIADCEYEGKKYSVEYTSVGSFTIHIISNDRDMYLNSNNNPYGEGMFFADQYIQDETQSYIVYGLGLGYHIKAMAVAAPDAKITVYESDSAVIKLADEYGALDMSKKIFKNVTIIEDIDFSQIRDRLKNIDDSTQFLVHTPSLNNISNEMVREKLEEYFLNISSIKNQKKFLDANFKKNIQAGHPNVDTLKSRFEGKAAVLVARGPSLNDDIEALKRIRDEVVIVAVYSVADFLINNGIMPDYMVVSDAQTNISNEVKNEALNSVPLIYVSTAAHNVIESHKGDNYILLQEGYNYAEEIAKDSNNMLFSTGGSVATVIMDMCIRLGCSKIICLGLDLAYINNKSHAQGTGGRDAVDSREFRTVMDVNGNPISTRKNLDIYRKWIERRIEKEHDIEFINASGGAFINGMKNQRIGRLGNILVYYGNSSYKSLVTFAQQLITSWEIMGYNVVAVNGRDKEAERMLMNAGKNKYDFIFSMDGILANTQYEDGTYVQNDFECPFVTMLVDHPLYFNDRLDAKLNNYNVLVVDGNHEKYIKKHYEHIKNVRMLPHGGIGVDETQIVPFADRKIDILFLGSYCDPEEILKQVGQLPRMGQVCVMNIIEQMIQDKNVTVEQGLEHFVAANDISLSNNEFKMYMELGAFADKYIRALHRNIVLIGLMKSGIKVNVFGNGWNKFKCANPGNMIIGGSLEPMQCMELMANSKIVLNVMPWYKDGTHERVFNAMMAGAVCLTDESEYLRREFTDGEDIVFYSMSNLSAKVKAILNDTESSAAIAENGYAKAKSKHTWANRAHEIIEFVNEIKN